MKGNRRLAIARLGIALIDDPSFCMSRFFPLPPDRFWARAARELARSKAIG